MSVTASEFKRYRSGNCWVTAAVLDEDVTVEIVGEGVSTVASGMVLIVTPNASRFECHSPETFFDILKFEEVPVKEVVNAPAEIPGKDDVVTTTMVGGGTLTNDPDTGTLENDEVTSESDNHVTNVVVPDSMGTGTVQSGEGIPSENATNTNIATASDLGGME